MPLEGREYIMVVPSHLTEPAHITERVCRSPGFLQGFRRVPDWLDVCESVGV